MAIPRTVPEKIADWSQAYWAVSSELTPQNVREVLKTMQGVTDPGSLSAAERLARLISSNDRTAALVAAFITGYGNRPVPIETGED
jgi:hypothetical protein